MSKKKHHIYMIEFIIIFFLISLLSIPLARSPIKFFQSEIISLEQIESERIAENTYAEIKTKLFEREIDFEKTTKQPKKIALPNMDVVLDGINKTKIQRHYQLLLVKEKSTNGSLYKLIKLQIFLSTKNWKSEKIMNYLLLLNKQTEL